jgi:Tfp pilus assembly protein PilN
MKRMGWSGDGGGGRCGGLARDDNSLSRFLDLLSQEQSFSNVTGCFDR